MAGLLKRQAQDVEATDANERFERLDRLFEDWMRAVSFRWPMLGGRGFKAGMIPIEEYQDAGTLVVRAEMPGIDPDRDLELTVTDDNLRIHAERREEEKVEEGDYVRREVRYGTFTRTVPLPPGVTDADITANYKAGVLEVRIPTPDRGPARKIPITKT
jgi:HSP20 family protein